MRGQEGVELGNLEIEPGLETTPPLQLRDSPNAQGAQQVKLASQIVMITEPFSPQARVCVVRRKKDDGAMFFPGGKAQEQDGGPQVTVRRESREETTFVPPLGSICRSWEASGFIKGRYLLTDFAVNVHPNAVSSVVNNAPHEHEELQWLTMDQLLQIPKEQQFDRLIPRVQAAFQALQVNNSIPVFSDPNTTLVLNFT